jgi:penicillin amidase
MVSSWKMGGLVMVLALVTGCGGEESSDGGTLPRQDVEIVTDDYGIPHIYAKSDEDLFFAYGYQLATDRMLQLDLFRRFSQGRLAEVLGKDGPGSAGDDALTDDRFARIFNWKHWGKLDAELMKAEEPEHYALTGAWVAGINRRVAEIREGKVALPAGFGPSELDYLPESWETDDVYVIQKMVGFGLDQTIQFEVFVTFTERFAPGLLDAIQLFKPARQVFTVGMADKVGAEASESPRAPAGPGYTKAAWPDLTKNPAWARWSKARPLGSNNWAVDGRHTKNGRPLLAGDPHLGYNFSGITYGVHLSSTEGTGTYDAAGFSFVGAPGIFAGHNDKVAWTETSSFADVMDMWSVEKKDGTYRIGDEFLAPVLREETILVRDGNPDVITVADVPGRGVIMPSSLVGSPIPIAGPGREVLIGWTGFRARPARFFRELNRARTVEELDAAIQRMPEMSYNFVGADASGIAYRVGIEVPKRSALTEGREPYQAMNGDDAGAFWPGGSLDYDQLPNSRGAERGFIVTANNDPFGFTANGRVDDDPYYYGALFVPGWRAGRIQDELTRLIAEKPKQLDVEDMQKLQMDVHDNLADDLLPTVFEVVSKAASGTDPDLAALATREDVTALVAQLQAWDRRLVRDSSAAVVFHALSHLIAKHVLEDDLNPVLFQIVMNTAPMYLLKVGMLAVRGDYPDGDVAMQEGRDRIVLDALIATADWLKKRFGTLDPKAYRYADVRFSSMEGAYGRGIPLGKFSTDGGESTVNVAQSKFLDDGQVADEWISHWGPIERTVFDFDDDGTPRARYNFPLGNSAESQSPFHQHAMQDWIDGNYRELPFRRSEVEARVHDRSILPGVER